jgi:hypothetical protein
MPQQENHAERLVYQDIRRALIFPLFVLIATLVCSTTLIAGEKDDVLAKCRKYFGKPVDQVLHLYSLNQKFVVQAKFEGDVLIQFAIRPKEWFNDSHPEWKESRGFPRLSFKKFFETRAKLAKIKPIGNLIWEPQVDYVTNSTHWHGQYFENAFIDNGWFPKAARLATINYFHPITGAVVDKRDLRDGTYLVYLEATEGDYGHQYYVKKGVFDALVLNKIQTFEGAFVN